MSERHNGLFSGLPPRDIVPGRKLTREQVLKINAAIGTTCQLEIPGEVTLDMDGIPIAVGPSRSEPHMFAGFIITERELADLDLSPEQVPHIRVIERKNP